MRCTSRDRAPTCTSGCFRRVAGCGARLTTVDGIVHAPNLPTEEVFTTPDPERIDGHVTLDQAAVHRPAR